MANSLPNFSRGEERFNAITHIIGGGFGISALVLCTVFGVLAGHDGLGIFSLVVYGVGMIILYTMSSIYHFLHKNLAKKVFRVLDHCTIYLLIAGTYTPLCLISMRDTFWGIFLVIFVWVIAITGITLNAINMHSRFVKITSMFFYVLSGWAAVIGFVPVINALGKEAFGFILGGGIAYTVGILFYSLGKKIPYSHSIWHLFVLLGTLIQFFGIFFYVIL